MQLDAYSAESLQGTGVGADPYFAAYRLIPDKPWHHLTPRVSGIVTSLTTEEQQEILAVDATIRSLLTDIGQAAASADVANASAIPLFRLQADYSEFYTRWDTWLSEGYDTLNDGWILTARPTLKAFRGEYQEFADRFNALGFRPTAGLPAASKGPLEEGPLDALKSWLPWLALGAIAWVAAPIVVPFITAHAASRKSEG